MVTLPLLVLLILGFFALIGLLFVLALILGVAFFDKYDWRNQKGESSADVLKAMAQGVISVAVILTTLYYLINLALGGGDINAAGGWLIGFSVGVGGLYGIRFTQAIIAAKKKKQKK